MKTLLRFAAVLSLALMASFAWSSHAVAQNNPEGMAYANVVLCTDADCTTTEGGMEGAVITSLDAAGVEIDSCAVEVFPSGLDGCIVTQHAGDGSYAVSNLHEGYALLSEAPEVLESESHGTQLVWYAAPVADDTAPPPAEVDPIDEFPEVGVGVGIGSQTGLLAVAAFVIALMAIGAGAVRGVRR